MKERVGFIGIGQAGGNITSGFNNLGYSCIAINSSKEDLAVVDIENKLLIPNANGCNHDRDKSKVYIKRFYKEVIDVCKNIFKDVDVVYTVYSAGGGTGSGAGPLITELLSNVFLGKVIGSICIIPDLNEPIKIQINAYKCLVELSSIDSMGGVFVIDNTGWDKLEINKEVIYLLDNLFKITDHVSIKGNIDEADIYEFLKLRGCVDIARINKDVEMHKVFPVRETDGKAVYNLISMSKNKSLEELKGLYTNSYDLFLNYNDTEETLIAVNGLSFYKSRIDMIKDKIELNKASVQSNILNAKKNKLKDELDWEINIEEEKLKEEYIINKDINEDVLKGIFDKY